MPDLSDAEREAFRRAFQPPFDDLGPAGLCICDTYPIPIEDHGDECAVRALYEGWLAARDYYEERHVDQQAKTLEALREAEERERLLRGLELHVEQHEAGLRVANEEIDRLCVREIQAEELERRLRKSLERYGHHEDGCPAAAGLHAPSPQRCTCGYHAALAAVPEGPGEPSEADKDRDLACAPRGECSICGGEKDHHPNCEVGFLLRTLSDSEAALSMLPEDAQRMYRDAQASIVQARSAPGELNVSAAALREQQEDQRPTGAWQAAVDEVFPPVGEQEGKQ